MLVRDDVFRVIHGGNLLILAVLRDGLEQVLTGEPMSFNFLIWPIDRKFLS